MRLCFLKFAFRRAFVAASLIRSRIINDFLFNFSWKILVKFHFLAIKEPDNNNNKDDLRCGSGLTEDFEQIQAGGNYRFHRVGFSDITYTSSSRG